MTNEKIKRMFDACYQAKRIREMLPPLPPGVMPSYIQYLDVIRKLEGQGTGVKVSDISDAAQSSAPRCDPNRKRDGKKRDISVRFLPRMTAV